MKPACRVKPGEQVVMHAMDCFSNQLTSEDQLVTSIDFSRVNPATGSVYIESASPGDALSVYIEKIEMEDPG